MLVGNTSKDEVNTRSLQRETSEMLNQFPANTNVLVVDTNFETLLKLKDIMRRYAYQVKIETDAEKALTFLTSCKHEINLVIWDYHMPAIDGLQALKSIGSKMDLPVVIMSDDNQTESVMKATLLGACDYVLKPFKDDIIANIWQHIVRKKMMSKPDTSPPVKSDLAQSDGLEQGKVDSKIVDQEQNIDKKEERAAKRPWMSWTGDIQPVQSDMVQFNDLDQHNDYTKTINQDNDEQTIDKKDEKAAKIRRIMTWAEEIRLAKSDLVQTEGFNKDNNIQKMERKVEKKARKTRMTWTEDLDQKFREAIEIVGGIEKANPKLLLDCLQEMGIEGLTRTNVSSHLQKHRISLEETQIPQQMLEMGWSTAYGPAPYFQSSNNVHTDISSYLMNGRAMNPIQQNQYQNGYVTMNNNQFITNHLPHLPYSDHHLRQPQQQQYYESSPQFNYVMSNEEAGQASGIYAPDHELTYPNLSYNYM